APRFDKDKRTPLDRLVDDEGPKQYSTDRLAQVVRDTIKKELSNLFAFLRWTMPTYLASLPPYPKLPRSALGTRSGPQSEEPVDVTYEEALGICAGPPEGAVKGGRGIVAGRPIPPKAFRVRDVCRLSYELALRPSDVQRLEMDRHWRRGQRFITFTPDIQ